MGPRREVVAAELSGAELGDKRRSKRAEFIGEKLAANPSESFPNQMEDDAALEGLYRFLGNDQVEFEPLLAPHVAATAERARQAGSVLAIHDTTWFSFGGEAHRDGLGRVKKGGQGFSAHTALVARILDGQPLGVIGVVPTVRDEPLLPREQTRAKVHDREREFERWETLAKLSAERLAGCRVIHVMDREADAYTLFHTLCETKQDFVIRSKSDRVLDQVGKQGEQPHSLYESLDRAPLMLTREVQLTAKRPDRMARLRKVPARMTRMAELAVTATRVELRHPTYTAGKSRKGSGLPRAIALNVVHAYEIGAFEGQAPIEWVLYTTLDVDTPEQVSAVIDAYRRRWLIEEYFKALKSGCAFEKRQLESLHALLNALAIFTSIAWKLLSLRHLARDVPDGPASDAFSKRQIAILEARGKVRFSPQPTLRQAMLAVAAEGGHIRNNGDPGWQVLGRGYEKLLMMELGYRLARQEIAEM